MNGQIGVWCLYCRSIIPANAGSCPSCRKVLLESSKVIRCPGCGRYILLSADTCETCGFSLAAYRDGAEQPPPKAEIRKAPEIPVPQGAPEPPPGGQTPAPRSVTAFRPPQIHTSAQGPEPPAAEAESGAPASPPAEAESGAPAAPIAENQSEPKRPKAARSNWKRLVLPLAAAALLSAIGTGAYIAGNKTGYAAGYAQGEHDGIMKGGQASYDLGYADGFSAGDYERGYSEGHDDGFTEGSLAGYSRGYDEGEKAGYSAGYRDGRQK